MVGFLQRFYEEDTLYEVDDGITFSQATRKAVELAMLGLPQEANAILTILLAHGHSLTYANDRICAEFFWSESDIACPDQTPIPNKEHTSCEDERLQKVERDARDLFSHLPEWSLDEKSFEELSQTMAQWKEGPLGKFDTGTTGFPAMRLSAALAAKLYIAAALGWQEDVEQLMLTIACRIHNNQQSMYLGMVRPIWRPYLLSSWLREKLEVDLEHLRNYAHLVYETTKKRLEEGPRHPSSLYKDRSVRQVLDEVNRNTVTDPHYESEEEYVYLDVEGNCSPCPGSIFRPPATPEAMAQAEKRMGRKIPDDVKEFLLISNGCTPVKSCPRPVLFDWRLVSLEQMFFEDDDYMECYDFALVHGVKDIVWPPVSGGAIAMYEHEGQHTLYVWIVNSDLVAEAKRRLQAVYNAASESHKAAIDRQIAFCYGSRNAYDDMTAYCIYAQSWGGPGEGKAFPDFRSYLDWVAYETRDQPERSPVKMPEDD